MVVELGALARLDAVRRPLVRQARATLCSVVETERGVERVRQALTDGEGNLVAREQVARAVEVDGEYVILSSDDVKALDDVARGVLELRVRPAAVFDAVQVDKPYLLAPAKGREADYALLCRTLTAKRWIGETMVTLRTRSYPAWVVPSQGVLILYLRFYAEQLDAAEIEKVREQVAGVKVSAASVGMLAAHLAAQLPVAVPERDPWQERLDALVAQRRPLAPVVALTTSLVDAVRDSAEKTATAKQQSRRGKVKVA